MPKDREGFHNLFVQIPEILWQALLADAERATEPVTTVVTRLLCKHYRLNKAELPKPRRAGRKPKTS